MGQDFTGAGRMECLVSTRTRALSAGLGLTVRLRRGIAGQLIDLPPVVSSNRLPGVPPRHPVEVPFWRNVCVQGWARGWCAG